MLILIRIPILILILIQVLLVLCFFGSLNANTHVCKMSAKAAHAAQHVSLLKPCNSLGLQIPHCPRRPQGWYLNGILCLHSMAWSLPLGALTWYLICSTHTPRMGTRRLRMVFLSLFQNPSTTYPKIQTKNIKKTTTTTTKLTNTY